MMIALSSLHLKNYTLTLTQLSVEFSKFETFSYSISCQIITIAEHIKHIVQQFQGPFNSLISQAKEKEQF